MSDPRDNSTRLAINTGERFDREQADREAEARVSIEVLGRTIGNCDDFEDNGDQCFTATNFVPSPGIDLAEGHLGIDYAAGLFLYWNDRGDIIDTRDIIEIVSRLPRASV